MWRTLPDHLDGPSYRPFAQPFTVICGRVFCFLPFWPRNSDGANSFLAHRFVLAPTMPYLPEWKLRLNLLTGTSGTSLNVVAILLPLPILMLPTRSIASGPRNCTT